MSPVIEEKEPGVYVRSQTVEVPAGAEKDHLDFFWEPPSKRPFDSQKNRIGIFAAGFVSGVFLTLLVTLVVFMVGRSVSGTPGTTTVDIPESTSALEDLIQEEVSTPSTAETTKAVTPVSEPVETTTVTTEAKPEPTTKPVETTAAVTKPTVTGSQEHSVQSGDTLGGIANKYYGDSSPTMVDKIMRANKLSNEKTLQINQKLVIPPKSY